MPASSIAPQGATKEDRLYIRMSAVEKEMLAEAARLRHLNTTQFVLQASLDAAQEVLAEQTVFRLAPEAFAAFCARLDEPAREIPQLKSLFQAKSVFAGAEPAGE